MAKLLLKEQHQFLKNFLRVKFKNILNIEHKLYPKVIAKLLDKETNIDENNLILCYGE